MLHLMLTMLQSSQLRCAALLGVALTLTACTSRRVLRLENRLLQQENTSLLERVLELEQAAPDPRSYERHPTLKTVHRFLERASYLHTLSDDASLIQLEFVGENTTFGVRIQHFDAADILFIATTNYLKLEDAQDTRSLVLLFIQIAALNYEMLWGKFQLNPESGEVLLSVELSIKDGVSYDTVVGTLEHLCQTADARYPDLERAAAGLGL